MISWLQSTFQHHFKIVFAVLLVGVIIAFVFTIGASPGIGRADRNVAARQFFDLNLHKAVDQQILMGDANLSYYLNYGSNMGGDQLQMYALERYAALSIARELHLPEPTKEDVADFIKALPIFMGQNGEFDPAAYNRFRQNVKSNGRGSESDVFRVISTDCVVARVKNLFAGPGYVMNADIAQELARAQTSWTLAAASVPFESFKPSITPSEMDVSKYFQENIFRYEIPPKFNGTFVNFPLETYLPQVVAKDEDIRAFYEANQARFPAPTQPEGAPKLDALAAFNAVKAQVESAFRIDRARKLAIKYASDITVSLFEKKADASTIGKLLAEFGLVAKELPPFARDEPPAQLASAPELANEAFKLGADRLFSDALSTPGGAIVLIWNSTIPSRKPELSEVREKVVADFTEIERRKRFIEAGKLLKASIEARIKAGEAFAAAADAGAAAASLKVETKVMPAFTLSQPPQDLDYTMRAVMERLEKGQVSDMAVSGQKGIILFAQDKVVPDLSSANQHYANARNQIARISGGSTAVALLGEIVNRELKKSAPAEP